MNDVYLETFMFSCIKFLSPRLMATADEHPSSIRRWKLCFFAL